MENNSSAPFIAIENMPANFRRPDGNLKAAFDTIEAMGVGHAFTHAYGYHRPWVQLWPSNSGYYEDTTLAVSYWDEMGPDDALAAVCTEAEKRGIPIHINIRVDNVPWRQRPEIRNANWDNARKVDLNGGRVNRMCLINPDFRAHYTGLVRDLFENYPLHGARESNEVRNPLEEFIYMGTRPNCFCVYCNQQARERGIDPDRVKAGLHKFIDLFGLLRRRGDQPPGLSTDLPDALAEIRLPRPPDGFFVSFLRILLNYPEILAWDQYQHKQQMELREELSRIIKSIRPEARVGFQISNASGLFSRAHYDLSQLSDEIDYVRPNLFTSPKGMRFLRDMMPVAATLFGDLGNDPDTAIEMMYAFFGYTPQGEKWQDLLNNRFDSRYVTDELTRIKASVNKNTAVYAGIAASDYSFQTQWRQTYEQLCEDLEAANQAGADGIFFGSIHRPWIGERIGQALRDTGWI